MQQPPNTAKTLLLIIHHPEVQDYFRAILEAEGYNCLFAADGFEALRLLEKMSCSLLISEVDMAGMSGVELLTIVRSLYPSLAVIMKSGITKLRAPITTGAQSSGKSKRAGIDELLGNIQKTLHHREIESINHEKNIDLTQISKEKIKNAERAYTDSMAILSQAAEFRDTETAQHNTRIGLYCELLAKQLKLTDSYCKLIQQAGRLHDVGKIGIPDEVLLKEGPLNEQEFAVIQTHCEIGSRILAGSQTAVFQLGQSIALSHHEKYDGSGYPKGLKKTDIPLEGRITAVCDVFDALTSDRIYKKAVSTDKAIITMKQEQHQHFDPEILDLFIANIEPILKIKAAHREPENQKYRTMQNKRELSGAI